MRTLIVILALAAVSLTAKAGNSSLRYIITDSDTLICIKFRIGLVNTKCDLVSGKGVSVSNKNIKVIGRKGKILEKKPIYHNEVNTGRYVFMELIDCQDGFRIYKYEHTGVHYGKITTDVVISYYKNGKYLFSLLNPEIDQVYDVVEQYKLNNSNFLTLKN